jgi:hypothetical protein
MLAARLGRTFASAKASHIAASGHRMEEPFAPESSKVLS